LKKAILSLDAPKPVGPYSQAVLAGNFLFISGQLAIDPKENKLVAKDISSQTRQVMENIKVILETADFNLKDVVQATVYLSSMSLFDEFNREFSRFFQNGFPARTTVATELKYGALVEVSAVAYKD
jgi:2-iminobutanoate/2-iminopropanoate deaminase